MTHLLSKRSPKVNRLCVEGLVLLSGAIARRDPSSVAVAVPSQIL